MAVFVNPMPCETLIFVVGARPNFIKVAPILAELRGRADAPKSILVHTGQHHDQAMKTSFFEQLDIPEPDVDLGVSTSADGRHIGKIIVLLADVLMDHPDAAVVVVGDVDSTLAAALCASKAGHKVVHIESGLRSFDLTMPEEVNRIIVDRISDLLFTTEPAANENLADEGIDKDHVHFVGNVMIDTLKKHLPHARSSVEILDELGASAAWGASRTDYGVVTLHRASNVDSLGKLSELFEALCEISKQIPLVFPLHPRTRLRLEEAGLLSVSRNNRLFLIPPQGYLNTISLLAGAELVITDSGGIQEETTYLGVPCLTVRENTERPVTISHGTNTLIGTEGRQVIEAVERHLSTPSKKGIIPEKWDGDTASRIVDILMN
jgi:UDP-N-acetylglucosamine 2-epimerase (non-hydrolysing)